MNLYLVLAIALGAISGVVEAPAARPLTLATQRSRRSEQREVRRFAAHSWQFAVQRFFKPRTANRELRTIYGNSSPRAPATA